MDYPDVSYILQVGLTDREQYIHRLGRTARAGKAGKGMLLLCPFERFLLRSIQDMPITERAYAPVDVTSQHQRDLTTAMTRIPGSGPLHQAAEQAYA